MRALKRYLCLPAIFAVCAVFALAAPAMAASTAQQGYDPNGTSQVDVQSAKSSNPNVLPFTGLDVGFVVMAGGALLGVGFGLRRLTRRAQGDST